MLFQALEVAGQVAGTSVSTSPLPYNTMASQCEALGTGTRKKLSNWLANDNRNSNSETSSEKLYPVFPANGRTALCKVRLNFVTPPSIKLEESLNYY